MPDLTITYILSFMMWSVSWQCSLVGWYIPRSRQYTLLKPTRLHVAITPQDYSMHILCCENLNLKLRYANTLTELTTTIVLNI